MVRTISAGAMAAAMWLAIWPGTPLAGAAGAGLFEGYMDHAALTTTVTALDAEFESCAADVIGASRQSRGLILLTLSSDPATAAQRPAVLIAAGLDGRHFVGTETAMRVARLLLHDHGDLLRDVTVYVIPRANPDAAEMNLAPVNAGQLAALREIDDDRDGRRDENGPADLNGDGVIAQMRRLDPPLDDPRTHAADPAEPRLLIKPDSAKGQTATYSVYVEGLDADDDGAVAEDGPGGIDLDRNFPHRWPEFDDRAGPYQLSEPESAALAQFVIGHRNIVAAVVFGRHDNLINVSDGKGKDATGRGPKDLDEDDVELYRQVSKKFKDVTNQKRAPKEDAAGSFEAWLYAQRGIPSFATVVWGRPDPSKAPDAENDEEKKKKEDAPKPVDEEAAQWLAYSDRDRGGAGYIAWTPFEHPTLGKVEVGGFVPGFMMNPPAGELDALAAGEVEFVIDVMNRRPKLAIVGPDVTQLAPNVYEIRLAISNEGYLPTATAIARKARSVPPTIVRLSSPVESIVAGDRVSRTWGIDGSGGRFSQRWIVRADDGADLSIDIVNNQLGNRTISFKAIPTVSTPTEPAGREAAQ